MSREITPTELIARLSAELSRVSGAAALVFDADGTLWSGDVGDDLFFHATERNLLRSQALGALVSLASAHGLDTDGTPSQVAVRMYRAHAAGRFPERILYEMMAWCFAGFGVGELDELARDALTERRLRQRRFSAMTPILAWARSIDVRTVMVTASPRAVAEVAGAECGFSPEQIIGCQPRLSGGVVEPELGAPIPYGTEKTRAGERLLGEATWLAAFGDSDFDFDMIARARVPVGVRPKPTLLRRLSSLDRAVLLM